jgi:hypothetical protein
MQKFGLLAFVGLGAIAMSLFAETSVVLSAVFLVAIVWRWGR